MTDRFKVTHALMRGMAATFEQALALEPPPEPINVKNANHQHDQYASVIKKLVTNVVELPADDTCPDCVFIEDTVLVISEAHAIITRPGAPSRRPETAPIAAALRALGIPRVDELQPPATLDGGDVQILPYALLVGVSARTNAAAVSQLRDLMAAAGGPPVYDFDVAAAIATAATKGGCHSTTLHFKSVLSALDPNTLLVADTPIGHALADQIYAVQDLASRLEIIFVPDTLAANVLSAGDHIVMQEGCPASEFIIAEACARRGLNLHTLCMSELAKADGALTCCSVLFAAAGGSGAGGEV